MVPFSLQSSPSRLSASCRDFGSNLPIQAQGLLSSLTGVETWASQLLRLPLSIPPQGNCTAWGSQLLSPLFIWPPLFLGFQLSHHSIEQLSPDTSPSGSGLGSAPVRPTPASVMAASLCTPLDFVPSSSVSLEAVWGQGQSVHWCLA